MSRESMANPERRVLARGTVLVDPRAAIAKLREFQLPDPALYVLELVRVAVASGASRVEVFNDADELRVTFDGDALAAEELARLLDHLFSTTERRLRLLAIAVNTALGLSPRSVDLYTTRHGGPAGTVARVRWTARHLQGNEPQAEGVPPPEHVHTEYLAPLPDMPAQGTRVYVVERFGSAVFWEYFRAEPAETQRLRAHGVALSLPVFLNGRAFEPAPPPAALLTVPLPGAPALRGSLSLLPPDARGSNSMQLCEHGVLLQERALFTECDVRPPPLWLRLDVDELPTNASRDAVDLTGSFGRDVTRRTSEALATLFERAREQLEGPQSAQLRSSLRSLLWSHFGQSGITASTAVPAPWTRLLDVPLFPLATGGFATAATLRKHDARTPLLVWSGKEPLDPALVSLLGAVYWLTAAEPALGALLGAFSVEDVGLRLASVQAARARQMRFLERPEQPVRLGTYPRNTLLAVVFGEPDLVAPPRLALPHGLRGELCLRLSDSTAGQLRLTCFVENRPLATDTLTLPLLKADVAMAATVLRARDDYEGLSRGAHFDACVEAMHALIIEALLVLCTVLAEPERASVDDPRVTWLTSHAASISPAERGALFRALCVLMARGRSTPARRTALSALLSSCPALGRLPAWPRVDASKPPYTTEALVQHCQRDRPVLYFSFEATRARRTDDTPLLALADLDELNALDGLLPARRSIYNYQPWSSLNGASYQSQVNAVSSRYDCVLALRNGEARVAVAPTLDDEPVLALHQNVPVPLASSGTQPQGVFALLEDPSATPTSAGIHSLAALSPAARELLVGAPWDLVSALCQHFEGNAPDASLWLVSPSGRTPAMVRLLLWAYVKLVDVSDAEPLGYHYPSTAGDIRRRLDVLALLPVLDGSDRMLRVSLAALRARAAQKSPVTYLTAAPDDVDLAEWQPLFLPHASLEPPLSQALGVSVRSGQGELPERRRAALRLRARNNLVKNPAVALTEPPGVALLRAEVYALQGVGKMALCLPAQRPKPASFNVLVDGRLALVNVPLTVSGSELPLLLQVAFDDPDRCLDDGFEKLTDVGRQELKRLLDHGLHEFSEALGGRTAEQGPAHLFELELFAFRVDHMGNNRRRGQRALERFATAAVWPTLSGQVVSARGLVHEGQCRYCTHGFTPWLPAAPGEDEVAPTAVLSPNPKLATCLAQLTEVHAVDVTAAVFAVQEQRRMRSDSSLVARVRLPGTMTDTPLRGRLEELAPAEGVGELVLLPEPAPRSAEVAAFYKGRAVSLYKCPSPVALLAALESVHLGAGADEGRVREFVWRLEPAYHALLDAALAAVDEVPSSWLTLLRWHALSARVPGAAAAALGLFRDTEGKLMSRADLDDQVRRFGSVARVNAMPPEPCGLPPEGRRAVVLEQDETTVAHSSLPLVDYSRELARALTRMRWYRQPPRPVIGLGADGEGALARLSLSVSKDQYEGEIALLPPSMSTGLVRWFKQRRPLGQTVLEAWWPALVCLEVGELEPDDNFEGPREDGARKGAEKVLRRRINQIVDASFAPPPDALAFARVNHRASPDERVAPTVRGVVYLPPVFAPRGSLELCVPPRGARESWLLTAKGPRLANHYDDAPLPLCGTLWVHLSAGASPQAFLPQLERALRVAYAECLRSLRASAGSTGLTGAALDHYVYASALDFREREGAPPAMTVDYTGLRLDQVLDSAKLELPLRPPRDNPDWYRALRALDMLSPPPEAVVNEPVAAPAPAPPPAPAPTPAPAPAPAPPVEFADGIEVRKLLLRAGLPSRLLDVVVFVQNARQPMVEYRPAGARALLAAEHPTVRALRGAPQGMALLAMMVLGELNRALGSFSDADEERVIEALLHDVVARDEKRKDR